jgi:hypothetical protein
VIVAADEVLSGQNRDEQNVCADSGRLTALAASNSATLVGEHQRSP